MQISLLKKDIISNNTKDKQCKGKRNYNNKKLIDIKAPSTSTRGPSLKISFFSNWEEHKKTSRVESDERKTTVRKDKLIIAR